MSDFPQLVTTDWLAGRLDAPDLRVFDTTIHLTPTETGYSIESGTADYERSHVPGAGFLDVTRELCERSSPLEFTMPSPEQMGAELGKAGVGPDSTVVVYSTSSQMWATRVWWMLRASGLDRVAVLDGGFEKWAAEGRPVSDGACSYPPAQLSCTRTDAMWADREEVLVSIGQGSVCTLNALPAPVHTGEAEFSYGRKGHIAGSRNVPYSHLFEAGTQVFRSEDELRAALDEVGAVQRERVICYCGGGISATIDAFALTLLGHPNVAVYDGSLREWAADESLPMESGSD